MNTRTAAALTAVLAAVPLVVVPAGVPAAAVSATPRPIALEEITPRSPLEGVSLKLKVKAEGHGTQVVDVRDASHVVTARITVQPGARFPWHTHPGPVVVNVVEGHLTYVDGDDCSTHAYPAGSAFTDTGDDVHSAYGWTSGATVLVATFFAAPASGPLTVTTGVPIPDC